MMKRKALFFITLSTLLVFGFIAWIGISAHIRHEQELNYLKLKQEAAKDLKVIRSKWKASRGINLTFSEPVESVTWSIQGRTMTTKLNNPSHSVLLQTVLPQGKTAFIRIQSVETTYKQNVPESWKLSKVMPAPLTASTNPGLYEMNVSRTGPYTIQFSAPIANRSTIENSVSFNPPISGKWTWENSETAEFHPNHSVSPTLQETMTIRGGKNSLESTSGQYLPANIKRPFITASDEEIIVNENLPETLTLYKNGKVIFKSKCNTAAEGAHTPLGTFYIQTKYPYVDMKGANPDGTTYNDPHVPWVMGLIGNVAIHGYPRKSYGFPQSDGCIELPIPSAKKLYGMVKVGTPVEIEK